VIACCARQLRPSIDWAFNFFRGRALRAYLARRGGQRLFFSPEAVAQWDQPLLRMSPLR
jgi:hypothetical protein